MSDKVVKVGNKLYKKHVVLADVNIPFKFSIDRNSNKLFFCMNADEFSDQSFQNVILDLNTESVNIVPNIRNGFASAVDQNTGSVYLGGSDGIYLYNYQTHDVEKPPIVQGVDVFDMYFKDNLYFVDTTNLDLHVLKNNQKTIVSSVEEYGIHHCVIDGSDNLILVNPAGVYLMAKEAKSPTRFCNNIENIRGITTDIHGQPFLIAQHGIYAIDCKNNQVTMVLPLENGYALAFDKDNNIIFSDGRSVVKLIPS
ncbi:ommochrome-binding protein-like [Bicyclus anynana]|uniref:Ommochrome-binding protein-like n=1 Tax=Bicyclus anynana TaxID=110368 RepID=A0A6J1MQH5_BICAN|nr:ommochrome-binding protein-like [Bicyclus anynana]